jgi:hypothetical protein
MISASVGGALLCLFVHALSWVEIRRTNVHFELPAVRSYYSQNVDLNDPGKPWLSLASVFLLAAFLTYLPKIYKLIKRKSSALSRTKLNAQLMTAGGLCFYAGADINTGMFMLGGVVMAYAGIGYLGYTRWERVRAQLYKD